MSKMLLPQAFWFRLAAECPHVDDMPGASPRGPLLDLSALPPLPNLGALEGKSSWATVRVGWNPKGLGITVEAETSADRAALDPDSTEAFADVNLWIDTRDTRNVSRATRFCHRFHASLRLGRDRKGLRVELAQRVIARAVADAPIGSPEALSARAELGRSKWSLALFLPATSLNGFDPDTNRRLGFAYQVSDHLREDQFMGVGRDFPLGENPSLWATLELRP